MGGGRVGCLFSWGLMGGCGGGEARSRMRTAASPVGSSLSAGRGPGPAPLPSGRRRWRRRRQRREGEEGAEREPGRRRLVLPAPGSPPAPTLRPGPLGRLKGPASPPRVLRAPSRARARALPHRHTHPWARRRVSFQPLPEGGRRGKAPPHPAPSSPAPDTSLESRFSY